MSGANNEPIRLSQFDHEVATWDKGQLFKAATAEGSLYTDDETRLIESELRKRRIPIPLTCPVCALVNPLGTIECAVCGHRFPEARSDTAAAAELQLCSKCRQTSDKNASECAHCGHPLSPVLQASMMLVRREAEIDALAARALKGTLMCILFPGYSLFIAPPVMNRAIDALGALADFRRQYPEYALTTSARIRAVAALLVGTVVFLMNAIPIVALVLRLSGLWPE